MTFGAGFHFCVGAALARMEIQECLARPGRPLRPHRAGRRHRRLDALVPLPRTPDAAAGRPLTAPRPPSGDGRVRCYNAGVPDDAPSADRAPLDHELLTKAFALAAELHRSDRRKGTAIPYLAHPMAIAVLVLEHGGTDQQAAAALLHDVVEDHGGEPLLRQIETSLGPEVAAIVHDCSDSLVEDPSAKPPWRERKECYVAHLADAREVPETSLLVSCADKLHNARAIVDDARAVGPALWARFHAGPAEISWYYRSLADMFSARLTTGPAASLARRLAATVSEARGRGRGGHGGRSSVASRACGWRCSRGSTRPTSTAAPACTSTSSTRELRRLAEVDVHCLGEPRARGHRPLRGRPPPARRQRRAADLRRRPGDGRRRRRLPTSSTPTPGTPTWPGTWPSCCTTSPTW